MFLYLSFIFSSLNVLVYIAIHCAVHVHICTIVQRSQYRPHQYTASSQSAAPAYRPTPASVPLNQALDDPWAAPSFSPHPVGGAMSDPWTGSATPMKEPWDLGTSASYGRGQSLYLRQFQTLALCALYLE